MNDQRIYLSPPNVGDDEFLQVKSVFDGGWIAPVGPSIDEFESRLSAYFDREVIALNSGTSALHLALIIAGVESEDHVLVSAHTFAACANVVLYERATPIFIDSESETWNIDPHLLDKYLSQCKKLPKAIIVTHIYGMPAKMKEVADIAKRYDIKLIEDAAESLGSKIDGQMTGGFGDYGVVSFNGNKIITTSAGGALICNIKEKSRGLHLATQANSGKFGYDHKEVGYNYRMSNVLAGIGIAQLANLYSFIARKRQIYQRYESELASYFAFLPEPSGSFSNRWLTAALVKHEAFDVEDLISFLDANNIESRRFWKPLNLHDAYASYRFIGGGVGEQLYKRGICLPSGTGLSQEQQSYVIDRVKSFFS
ncbi:aminotransferase class I/II-fold pyridoxal phosphate-dependent enzyme [Ekhidna sp.]|uniref:aminotransferase class I/II-fold pyridoxal phosphate-dependent enzyme n=1 Tax=Ekhidna sp. TaxID=2608089 RepID=UPI003BAA5D6E